MTFLTAKEAAHYLKMHEISIYRLLKKKQIPGAIKVGYHWRIVKEVLDKKMEEACS